MNETEDEKKKQKGKIFILLLLVGVFVPSIDIFLSSLPTTAALNRLCIIFKLQRCCIPIIPTKSWLQQLAV